MDRSGVANESDHRHLRDRAYKYWAVVLLQFSLRRAQ